MTRTSTKTTTQDSQKKRCACGPNCRCGANCACTTERNCGAGCACGK